jgi:hypothetical protein
MDRDHRPGSADPGPTADGWLGTEHLPAYRAGAVVVRLDELPDVDPDHLYVDVMLLDDDGAFSTITPGRVPHWDGLAARPTACASSASSPSWSATSSLDTRGLAPIGQALRLIRERGVEAAGLAIAAQLIDKFCDEDVVVASLMQGPRVGARQRRGAAPDAPCRHAARARIRFGEPRRRLHRGFSARPTTALDSV